MEMDLENIKDLEVPLPTPPITPKPVEITPEPVYVGPTAEEIERARVQGILKA